MDGQQTPYEGPQTAISHSLERTRHVQQPQPSTASTAVTPPQPLVSGAGGSNSTSAIQDPEDHRSSMYIAAGGFCFIAALFTSAGGVFISQPQTRVLGIVFFVVGTASILGTVLFLPATKEGKIPSHRQFLPLLLAVLLCAVDAWIIFLIAQTSVEGKGILAAIAAFLILFSVALIRVVCLRCCRRKRKRREPRGTARTRGRREPSSDSEDVQLEDFHHVNTQVRETLRSRFAEAPGPETVVPFVSDCRVIVPTAPPETPSTPSPIQQPPLSFSTFTCEQPVQPPQPQIQQPATVLLPTLPTAPVLDNPPPYEAIYRRTPPPPYSTLV